MSVHVGSLDPFKTRKQFQSNGSGVPLISLPALQAAGFDSIETMPYSRRALLEVVLRLLDGKIYTEEHVRAFFEPGSEVAVPFRPARVLGQDLTGIPLVVDLAAMRSAAVNRGFDAALVNPLIAYDLVIDHSVQVDSFGQANSALLNLVQDFRRNTERYGVLKWAQQAFPLVNIIPPGVGICHQVNLEFLTKGVQIDPQTGLAYFDSCFGTDSHTTMAGALGILAWGVGGIEALAALLNVPTLMQIPKVTGVRLTGALQEGVTSTDLVLALTEFLRDPAVVGQNGVVGEFVEFFGPGVDNIDVATRAVVSNMAPEYGATIGFFPTDRRTLDYYSLTSRSAEQVALVEAFCRAQGMFASSSSPEPVCDRSLDFDISKVVGSVAGPKLPKQRIELSGVPARIATLLPEDSKEGFAVAEEKLNAEATVTLDDKFSEQGEFTLKHGSVVLAAITSCTNTSNPSLMIMAALLAKKAYEAGLRQKPWVKTSFAPGSRVVTDYLIRSGLMEYLENLGFHLVGYGCTTCIGNSGPLPEVISAAIAEAELKVAAVLSGNRNFEGRVSPDTSINLLASPPLVIAYAIAGSTEIDILNDPIAKGNAGREIYLRDIWPTNAEVQAVVAEHVIPEQFAARYNEEAFKGTQEWQDVLAPTGDEFEWPAEDGSTYVHLPPWFIERFGEHGGLDDIKGAYALLVADDGTSTDHISPAGRFADGTPVAVFLDSHGVAKPDRNTLGSRRGDDRVMTRGTFANPKLVNKLVGGKVKDAVCGMTKHIPSGEVLSVFDAAMRYQQENTPLIIFGGKEYGQGSSRDWAAKGPLLQGVRAVIAESFERIHRANLSLMAIVPFTFRNGETLETLGLTGEEKFSFPSLVGISAGEEIDVTAEINDGQTKTFRVVCAFQTEMEIDIVKSGGVMPHVLNEILAV